jgi:hypothetical protein
MAVSEEQTKLTYRELADRLGISLAAARSRVRRARQQGRWRVVPSNHPNSPAQVELPATDFAQIASQPRSPRASEPQMSANEVSDTIYVATIKTLHELYRHVTEVNDRMQALIIEKMELKERLSVSEEARSYLVSHITELQERTRSQEERLTAAALAKLESAVEISRLSAICEERDAYIQRLEAGVRSLQSKVRMANRPLWRKLIGKADH